MPQPILLVEDNPHDLELTLLAFEQNGGNNEIIVVRDGMQALEYINCTGQYAGRGGGDPALVLMDVKLPKLDGIEVLHTLKSSKKTRQIPVVMLSTSGLATDIEMSYRLGANDYIVKPLDFRSLVQLIGTLGRFWNGPNQHLPSTHHVE